MALPPVVVWMIFWRWRVSEPEPNCVPFQLFFFGMISAVPLLSLREFMLEFPESNLFGFIASPVILLILFALFEEVLKGLFLIFGVETNRAFFDRPEDGFEFGVAVGLGFAFAENILYLFEQYFASGVSAGFWYTYLFRSAGTALAHGIFSGTFGYYYAYAYAVRLAVPKNRILPPLADFFPSIWRTIKRPFHTTIVHILRGDRTRHGHYPSEVIVEGLFVATILHAAFNWLLTEKMMYLTLPLLVGGTYFYGRRFVAGRGKKKRVKM